MRKLLVAAVAACALVPASVYAQSFAV